MFLTTTSKTGFVLSLFLLFGRVAIVIEVPLRFVFCLLVGGFLTLFIIQFLLYTPVLRWIESSLLAIAIPVLISSSPVY